MESNDAHCQLRRNADGDEIAAACIAWGVFRDRRPGSGISCSAVGDRPRLHAPHSGTNSGSYRIDGQKPHHQEMGRADLGGARAGKR